MAATKKIIFHLGLPRTGTTSIQKFLRSNDNALKTVGISYPNIDPQKYVRIDAGAGDFKNRVTLQNLSRGIYHEILATAVASQTPARKGRKIHVEMAVWADFINDFERGDCHTAIISFEGFGAAPHNFNFASLTGLLERFDCQGIIYHRRYDSWAKSLLEHSIRGKGRFKLDVDRFFNQQNVNLYPFAERINTIKKNLFLEKIHVRSFEKVARQDSLLEDFFETLGLQEAWRQLAQTQHRRANAALSPSQTLVLYQLNRWGVADDAFVELRQAFARSRKVNPAEDPYSIIPAPLLDKLRSMAFAEADDLHDQFGIEPVSATSPAAPLPHRLGRERFRAMIESISDIISPKTREEVLRRSGELEP